MDTQLSEQSFLNAVLDLRTLSYNPAILLKVIPTKLLIYPQNLRVALRLLSPWKKSRKQYLIKRGARK